MLTMRVQGARRKAVALLALAVLAALAWVTMGPGRVRMLVFVLLGGFALRILLTARSGYDEEGQCESMDHGGVRAGLRGKAGG
ncbi:MAG: hypothetical protein K6T49_10800 [Acidobacterium ailaaui]|nr:hypothetical protein [Pseudacidobacterium ailaaui]